MVIFRKEETMEDKIQELKKWVKDNYNSNKCGWTAERSFGNYDDCFDDGCGAGTSFAAYEVGCILGMELKEPAEPTYE